MKGNSTGSFYDFLVQNAQKASVVPNQNEEVRPTTPNARHQLVALVIGFFIAVTIVYFSYGALVEPFKLPQLGYWQCAAGYALFRTFLFSFRR